MIKELLPKDSETFDLTIANIGQKCKLTWIGKINNTKIMIVICSDSYQNQCKAISEVFNQGSLTWNHLYSIPYSLMKTDDRLAYRTNWNSEDWFEKDFKKVLENTLKILF